MRKKHYLLIIVLLLLNGIGLTFFIKKMTAPPLTQQSSEKNLFSSCKQTFGNDQENCMKRQVQILIKDKGVLPTIQLVSQAVNTDSSLLNICHETMHDIGKIAYQTYQDTHALSVSPDITLCSYGFYHGMMEEALTTSLNYNNVRSFCSYINTQLPGMNVEAECYHGIGHGIVLSHDISLSPTERVENAMQECKKATSDMDQQIQCSSGVFNGIANMFSENLALVDSTNPSSICTSQEEEFKSTCYAFIARVYLARNTNTFLVAVEDGERTVEKEYLYNFVSNLANNTAPQIQTKHSQDQRINECHDLSYSLDCITGSGIGLLQHGVPGKEYSHPIQFCNNALLSSSEKQTCFQKIFSYLNAMYPAEKRKDICQTVPTPFQYLCEAA